MTTSEIVAIIPVRFLPSTKHRLARSFDATQRRLLVHSMLEDVLNAIHQSKLITRSVIITSDDNFLETYTNLRSDLQRSEIHGLNQELTEFINSLNHRGTGHVIIVLGDLPLLTGLVLDDLIWFGLQSERSVIAQGWKGKGTNLLFFTYPLTFTLQFGKNSCKKHLEELKSMGFNPIIYHAMETALDIDDETAVDQLLKLARIDAKVQNTRTYKFLRDTDYSLER
jgi:2-phospho-L-lactate guanylyltransferase